MTSQAINSDEEQVLQSISDAYEKSQLIDKYFPDSRHRWTQSSIRQSWPRDTARALVSADLEQEFEELCDEMPSPARWNSICYQAWLDSCPKPYFTRRWHLLGIGFGPFVDNSKIPPRRYTREHREYGVLLDEHRRRLEDWCRRFDLHHALIAQEDATERRHRSIYALKKTASSQRKRPV